MAVITLTGLAGDAGEVSDPRAAAGEHGRALLRVSRCYGGNGPLPVRRGRQGWGDPRPGRDLDP